MDILTQIASLTCDLEVGHLHIVVICSIVDFLYYKPMGHLIFYIKILI